MIGVIQPIEEGKMGVVDGNEFAERLVGRRLSCRKCGEGFTFEEGVGARLDRGIDDSVVMCPKCGSVYEVNVTSLATTLLADVTSRYPGTGASSGRGAGKKRWQFWK